MCTMKSRRGEEQEDHESDQLFYKILWHKNTRSETKIFEEEQIVILFVEVAKHLTV